MDGIATADGRVVGVDTAEGRIEAPVVICAAGAWTTDLLAPIGIDAPIERRRLDMAYLEQPPGRPTIRTCITDGNSNVVMRPDMGPYLLAVAYPNEMPEVTDPVAPAPAEDEARHRTRLDKALAERLPDFVDAKVVRTVSGAYDITPDFHPILGWAPGLDGLYLAAGFSGHGLKLSPAVGECVAAAVLEAESPSTSARSGPRASQTASRCISPTGHRRAPDRAAATPTTRAPTSEPSAAACGEARPPVARRRTCRTNHPPNDLYRRSQEWHHPRVVSCAPNRRRTAPCRR